MQPGTYGLTEVDAVGSGGIDIDLRSRENELFNDWKRDRDYPSFVIDGAPRPDVFEDSPAKTVIVLKDINVDKFEGEFDLRKELEVNPGSFWREKVSPWCAGISNISKDLSWSELEDIPVRDSLAPFAFIQLKKTAGKGSVDAKTIREFARKDADWIRQQLGIYEPKVIICAGKPVGKEVARILTDSPGSDWPRTHRGIPYLELNFYGDRLTYLIDYAHPSARISKHILCYPLLDAYRELMNQASENPD